jgi:hypothetical protein
MLGDGAYAGYQTDYASGRKSEAPAPAAQQDKTAGRTELPHQRLKSITAKFVPINSDWGKLYLFQCCLFSTPNANRRFARRKAMAPKFGL